ncbi:hypothetical protein OY671_008644, partial [Metschnikowia pulcherrima]
QFERARAFVEIDVRRQHPRLEIGRSDAAASAAQPSAGDLFAFDVDRDRPVSVEGRAAPNAPVSGTSGAERAEGKADAAGDFTLRFAARPASAAPVDSAVASCGQSSRVSDSAVGDVWLCSGQSNMEFPSAHASNGGMEVARSADPGSRSLQVPKAMAYSPQRVFGKATRWAVAGPDSTAEFSAVCYFMARELRRARGVPIGAIHASWGGS